MAMEHSEEWTSAQSLDLAEQLVSNQSWLLLSPWHVVSVQYPVKHHLLQPVKRPRWHWMAKYTHARTCIDREVFRQIYVTKTAVKATGEKNNNNNNTLHASVRKCTVKLERTPTVVQWSMHWFGNLSQRSHFRYPNHEIPLIMPVTRTY